MALQEFRDTNQLSLMDQLLSSMEKSPTIGRIHNSSPIKIQRDPSKPPRINQYLKEKNKTI